MMILVCVGGSLEGKVIHLPVRQVDMDYKLRTVSGTYSLQKLVTPDGWVTKVLMYEGLRPFMTQLPESLLIAAIMTTWRAAWKVQAPIDNPRFMAGWNKWTQWYQEVTA